MIMAKSTLSGGNQVEKGTKTSATGRLFSAYYISQDLRSRSHKLFNQSAQGMVEFALTIPIILLMILGIIEGGRLIFIYSSLAAAGREAARYGAGIGLSSGTILYNDCPGIKDAAKRIGGFAGVTDSDINIFHDTGPDPVTGLVPLPTEYCNPSPFPVAFGKGDRIIIKINLSYTTMEPLIPIPPLTLHTENAHTVLIGAEVVAVAPPVIPGTGYQCDMTKYTISVDNPLGNLINATISQPSSGPATGITNILIAWDPTSNPKLKSIGNLNPGPGVGVPSIPLIDSTGPLYQKGVSWTFMPGSTQKFLITFDSVLKSNVKIQLTLNDANHCIFGY